MFRISYRAAICGVLASLAVAAGEAGAASVALVCDGEFRMQRASVEGTAEAMFAGTMHVALVAEDDSVVEVRLQAFEDGARTPVQTFMLPPVEEAPETGEMVLLFPELFEDELAVPKAEPAMPDAAIIPGKLTIDTTDSEIVLHHVVETGPVVKARVDGRPLVPTREKVETVEMRLDRSSGDLSLVWGEASVRNHRRPGAIRTSKVRLHDEKSYQAVCMPVRQRAF